MLLIWSGEAVCKVVSIYCSIQSLVEFVCYYVVKWCGGSDTSNFGFAKCGIRACICDVFVLLVICSSRKLY